MQMSSIIYCAQHANYQLNLRTDLANYRLLRLAP